jgi:hypothetical protein
MHKNILVINKILVFRALVAIRCEEFEQKDSWFNYHAHQQIYSIHFICEVDDKIIFYYIFFLTKKILFFADYGSWTRTKTNKAFLYKLTCEMMTIGKGALANG